MICFDENGVTMERDFSLNDLGLIIKSVELMETKTSMRVREVFGTDEKMVEELNQIKKIHKTLNELYKQCKEQNDRKAIMVISEPVEYEYDD